jgi:hypothetical protein
MNEENAHAWQQQPSSAVRRGQGPLQPERGTRKRSDREYSMKKTFISGALAFLTLAYAAHASAQQLSAAASAGNAGQSHRQTAEASFMAENRAAMNKMIMDMAVKPSGNVDADFTAMMIPHHQGRRRYDGGRAALRP